MNDQLYHKPRNQTSQLRDIHEIGSGQVKHQKLCQMNPSTRWGASPTGKRIPIDKIFFITTAFWMFESFNDRRRGHSQIQNECRVPFWNHAAAPTCVCAALVRRSTSANVTEFRLLVRNVSAASAISMGSQWSVVLGTLFVVISMVILWFNIWRNYATRTNVKPLKLGHGWTTSLHHFYVRPPTAIVV